MSIKPRLPNYRRRGKKLDGDSVADVAGDTTDMMEDNADEVGDTVADNDSIVAVLDDSVVEDTVSEGMYASHFHKLININHKSIKTIDLCHTS